jgi:hypothetical protein
MGIRMHDRIYVQKKSLQKTLKEKRKKKAFTEVKPEIEHFRIFGCIVYSHVAKENNSKIDPLERKDTINLQRHSRSTSLVRDRLRQENMFPLKKR